MPKEVSRRTLIKAAGGLTAASVFGLLNEELAFGAANKTPVRFANWSLYLDYDNKTKSYPTLVDFTKKTGIPVNYMEVVDDNDTFTAKVTPQLKLKKILGTTSLY